MWNRNFCWMESAQGLQLTSLTRTSLCPLAACWLSLSWLCSFTTSWVALRRWSSTTSSSASSRFTLCSNSRDRSRGIPPLKSVNDWILLLSSRFSSWSLATWKKKKKKKRQTNKRKIDQKLKHTIRSFLDCVTGTKKLDHYTLYKNKLQKLQISQIEILRMMILPCFISSCDIWNLFSRAPMRNCLWCYYRKQTTPIALEKCNKGMWYGLKYSGTIVQGFCPLKIKIT